MTIRIPRPTLIASALLLGSALVAMLLREGPDLWRYLKLEGM